MRLHAFLVVTSLAASLVSAQPAPRNGEQPLNHYALATLRDQAAGARIAARFKAKGQPVFLVHDIASGLRQGDIMRFQDKAALIDADVWQTLQAEGALEKLQASPLVRVTAKASESAWKGRASQVKANGERMAYLLGAELIKILQENFGGLPGREQFTMTFDGANLQLLAPRELLEQLKVAAVIKAPATGRPRFISPPPAGRYRVGDAFFWQPMAVDPADPDGQLRYHVTGTLPAGLSFENENHALKGKTQQAGRFALTAEVRNRQGALDTLGLVIEVAENRPPDLAARPKTVALAGRPWTFFAPAFDPDHAGDELTLTPGVMPPGMTFDAATHTFAWVPERALIGKSGEFSFTIADPLQAVSEQKFTLEVRDTTDLALTQDIRLQLPFDTLVQGRLYTWKAGATAMAWAQQGVKLYAIIGPDSTNFDGETLTLRAMKPGDHNLIVQFQAPGGLIQQALTLPVREDLPPRFVGSLTTDRLAVGQHARYRPAAVDPEGEPVALAMQIPEGSAWRQHDGQLELKATEPGLHVARITAQDPSGHTASQWIALQVEPAARPISWQLENRLQGNLATWSAVIDFGMGRMGIYTPGLLDAFSFTGEEGRDWPYVFFGGNLLGRQAELRGNRLFTDLGFTLRLPDPKIATGGLYGRLQGEWTFAHAAFSRIEAEFTGHVRQALVLTDTSGIKFIFGEGGLQLVDRYDPIVRRIMRDATAKDNAAFFTRVEAYSKLGFGFYAGPAIWREDKPMAQLFDQRIGGVLRYQLQWGGWLGQANGRLGWGPGGAGWQAYVTWRMSFGAPF